MSVVKFKLNGLTCGSCTKSVTSILSSHDNVKNVIKVDLEYAEVEVLDSSDAQIQELITEITDIGYEAVLA